MKLQSFKQRLSYAVNLAPVRVTFNSPEIEARATLARIRVKAEVHAENNPMKRAYFGHAGIRRKTADDTWSAHIVPSRESAVWLMRQLIATGAASTMPYPLDDGQWAFETYY